MTHVEVKDGNIEGALKRFKMKVQRSGIPTEMKKEKNILNLALREEKLKKKLSEMLKNITNKDINKGVDNYVI